MRLILAVCCFIIITTCLLRKNTEMFTPYLVYDITVNPNYLNIVCDENNQTPVLKRLSSLKNVLVNKKGHPVYAKDAFSYSIENTGMPVLSTMKDKKHAVILRPKGMHREIDIKQVSILGCYGRTEEMLARAIKTATGSSFSIKLLPEQGVVNKDSFTETDCLLVFRNMASIKIDGQIDLVTYENIDIHKLKHLIPYAVTEDIDFKSFFPLNYSTDFSIKRFIGIDMLLYGEEKKGQLSKQYEDVLSLLNVDDTNNYYSMFFDFFETSKDRMRLFNKRTAEKQGKQILEQYVNGFYNSQEGSLDIGTNKIGDVPMYNGDQVVLTEQDREEENGAYTFSGNILWKNREAEKPSTTKYECYGTNYRSKDTCLSSYDESGVRKKPGTWDGRCQTNKDCPYYQANKNYRNYLGGCMDGWCQFPIGMKNKTYRTAEGDPWCHGCPIENPACCKEQRVPDYAFELDMFQRKAHNI